MTYCSFSCNGLWIKLALAAVIGIVNTSGELAQAESSLSTVEPSDFFYPVEWLRIGPARERMQYSHLRNRMLKTGFEKLTSEGLKSAREDYEAARKLCHDDPRLDYAFGLVLWTHGRSQAAISQFEAAARLQGSTMPFIPGIEAAALGCLAMEQNEHGLSLLVNLARVISKNDFEGLSASQKRQAAQLLGCTIGYLEGPGRSDERDHALKQAIHAVVDALPPTLKMEFDQGRRQVATRQLELDALSVRSADELSNQFDAARSQIETQLAARNQTLQQTTKETTKAHGAHRKIYSETTAQMNAISWQTASLGKYAVMTNQAIATLSIPRERIGVRDVGPTQYVRTGKHDDKYQVSHIPVLQTYVQPETATDRQARLSQLNAVLGEMRQIQEQVNKLRQRADELDANRQASKKEYSQIATALRGELIEAQRDKRKLSQQLRKLELNYRLQVELKANTRSLLSYVCWDVNTQRDALTKSYLLTARSL